METSLKTGFAQIFSSCPKNLSCPNFKGGLQPPSPPPYAYGGHKAVHEELASAKEFSAEEIAAGAFKETDESATFKRSQDSECVATCEGKWFEESIQVLRNQEIMPPVFLQSRV